MSNQKLLEYSERTARREECMNTQQAKDESTLDRLQTDMAKRDKDNTRWLIGMWIAGILVEIKGYRL